MHVEWLWQESHSNLSDGGVFLDSKEDLGSHTGCLVPLSRKSKMAFLFVSISLRNMEFLAKVSVLDGCSSSSILFIRKVYRTFSSWALSSKNNAPCHLRPTATGALFWWFVVQSLLCYLHGLEEERTWGFPLKSLVPKPHPVPTH